MALTRTVELTAEEVGYLLALVDIDRDNAPQPRFEHLETVNTRVRRKLLGPPTHSEVTCAQQTP